MLFHRYDGDFPPGFHDYPLLYMVTVFSLLMVNLLALEWIWRLTWQMIENKFPVKHPVTVMRSVLLLLLTGAVIRSGPDCWFLIRWDDISPEQRLSLLNFDGLMDSISFVPFSLAWLIGFVGAPMVHYQLERKPPPIHLWPTWQQMKRPLKIGVGVFTLAVIFTFVP